MTIVYIPLEVTKRELDSKVLLATNLAHNGVPVVIGNKGSVYRFLETASEPGLLLYKSSSPAPLRRFKYELGHKFFGQDEEAGILGSYEDFYKLRYGAIDMADMTDRYFVWSQAEFDFLVKKLRMSEKKIINSGGIRTALWGGNGAIFYQKDVKNLKTKHGKYILIILTEPVATSYSHSIYNFSKYEILVDKFINMLMISIIEIILNCTDLNVVIRPHPAGSSYFWNKYFKKNPRVLISSEGTLLKWILGSYCVIHDGSTGGVEAAVSNIPTIFIERNHFISNKENLADKSKLGELGLNPKSMTHLLEILTNLDFFWSSNQQERVKNIDQYLTNSSSIDVINIVTKEILKEVNINCVNLNLTPKRDIKSEIHYNLMYKIPKLFLRNSIFIMERQKRPKITKKMLIELCSRSKKVLSIPNETKIVARQISFSTFLLYKVEENNIIEKKS